MCERKYGPAIRGQNAMPNNQTWPPPPDIPSPLTEHDELLRACVKAPTSKPPLSRLRLIRDLRTEAGLDLRQCLAVVNSYCDRNAILMPTRGPSAWFGCLPSLVQISTIAAMQVTWFFLERAHDADPTRFVRRSITAERIHLDLVFLGIILICAVFQLSVILGRAKQTRRDAAEARAKVAE